MTSKKKKIIILTGMVALLVLTGVLNIVLNLTADNALEVSGFQCGTANQATVYIGISEQFFRV